MNIDPVDDCTFWYVNEYLPTNGSNWRLRIGAFKFTQCSPPTAVTLASVEASPAPAPVPASVPLGALPVAAGLAMAAVYALRRRR